MRTPRAQVLQFACPKCGAGIGEPCLGKRGAARKAIHRARFGGTPRVRNPRGGSVYFIQAGAAGLIKIGFTDGHISARLQILQVGSPVPLKPLGFVRGPLNLEKELHARFAALREQGEWFRPEGDLLEFLETVEVFK